MALLNCKYQLPGFSLLDSQSSMQGLAFRFLIHICWINDEKAENVQGTHSVF